MTLAVFELVLRIYVDEAIKRNVDHESVIK